MLDGSWQLSHYFNGLVFASLGGLCVMSIGKRWHGLNSIDVGSGFCEPIRWAKEIALWRVEWHRQSDAKISRGSCS